MGTQSVAALIEQAEAVSQAIKTGLNGHGHEHDVAGAIPWGELLETELPAERPLVTGLIEEDTGNILGGAPNVGKSWLMLAMGRAIASGTAFLDTFATTQHDVLIVDEESHLRGLIVRARMLERALPLGRDLPLFFAVGLGLRVDAGVAVARLNALMTQHRPGLVFGDSLTRLHTANENSAGEMATVFHNVKALMRTHGCAFLFTDHTRKKGLINDVEETLRGSSEKRAWADTILAIEPGEQDRMQLVITHVKARHGQRHAPFGVHLDLDTIEGTAHLRYVGDVTSTAPSKANDIIAAIHAVQAQLSADAADDATIAAWLNCSPDTVHRHAGKLVAAGILAKRKVVPSDKGGRPKTIYDVTGGVS
jgi:hypothetical protein